MQSSSETDEGAVSYSHLARSGTPANGILSEALTYLAFQGHGIRIGIELALCVVFYTVFNALLNWLQPVSAENWHGLVSWFSACTFVITLDQFFLCRPVYIFRTAYQLSLAGAHDEALATAELIAPEKHVLVRCPAHYFHLLRAEILTAAETIGAAEREIQLAELAGADPEQIAVARSRLYRREDGADAYNRAMEALESAERMHGECAVITLEKGLLQLEARHDLWSAKRTLRLATEMVDQPHFIGDFTSNIARAGLDATRLWTGEAEEGLLGLSRAIDRLRSLAMHIDTLRPLLAWLLLERAHYLATHSEPEAACVDLRIGLTLCNNPAHRQRAEQVHDELEWRYHIVVPV